MHTLKLVMLVLGIKSEINVRFFESNRPSTNNHSSNSRTRFSHDGFNANVDILATGQIDVSDFGEFGRIEKVSEILRRNVICMIEQKFFQMCQLGKAL